MNDVWRIVIGYLLMFVTPLMLPALFVKLVGFEGLRNMFAYEPKATVIHDLDPRLKVLYPVVVGVLSVLLQWTAVWALCGLTLLPWALVKPSPGRLRVLVTMACVPVIGMVWTQGLFHAGGSGSRLLFAMPAALSWFGTAGLSSGGLLFAVQEAGRMLVTVSASLLLLVTTTPAEFVWAFERWRLPSQMGLAFSAALRFLPQMIDRLALLLKAIQVRGYDLTRPPLWSLWQWPRYLRQVLLAIAFVTVPLLVGSLRSTAVMAMVADARAFGSRQRRTFLRDHRPTPGDHVATAALTTLVLVVLSMVLFHVGGRTADLR